MVTKRTLNGWIKKLEKRRDAIGAERDKLREFRGDIEDLEAVCDSAYEDLASAIDRLSELT